MSGTTGAAAPQFWWQNQIQSPQQQQAASPEWANFLQQLQRFFPSMQNPQALSRFMSGMQQMEQQAQQRPGLINSIGAGGAATAPAAQGPFGPRPDLPATGAPQTPPQGPPAGGASPFANLPTGLSTAIGAATGGQPQGGAGLGGPSLGSFPGAPPTPAGPPPGTQATFSTQPLTGQSNATGSVPPRPSLGALAAGVFPTGNGGALPTGGASPFGALPTGLSAPLPGSTPNAQQPPGLPTLPTTGRR